MEQQFKVYDTLEDDPSKIDYANLGKVVIDEAMIMKYFPKNPKGITFSSKTFNPLGMKPKAPNTRLETSIKQHQERLDQMDLNDLLLFIGAIKPSQFIQETKQLPLSHFKKLLKLSLASKLTYRKNKELLNQTQALKAQSHHPLKRLYILEKILIQCEQSAHDFVISHTQQLRRLELSATINRLEQLLRKEGTLGTELLSVCTADSRSWI